MWPIQPDELEAGHVPPDGADGGDAWYFVFVGNELVVKMEHGAPQPITADDFRWFDMEVEHKHFLGSFRGRHCFTLRAAGQAADGFPTVGLRGLLGRTEQAIFYLAGRAQQVLEWHDTHRFCGRCGAEMEDHTNDRAKECPQCGLINYPRLSPSIIVLVTRGEEMLLARNAAWPQGMYSTLAGFVEPGESIEQTVHREVLEEVGLRLGELRYFGSQSWPFPNSLMLGFHAEYESGDIVCQEEEIADAQWFTADNMPQTPPNTAISGWLIKEHVDRVKAGAG